MTEPVNGAANQSPAPVRDGGNGPTELDEEALLEAKFGKPNADGVYGAAVIE